MQDGLTQRNTSVDDFLSLVASGDIPHQDPTLLNVPLMHQQQAAQGGHGNQSAASMLAQQQLLAHAANSGNSALANAIRAGSLGNLRSSNSGSFLNQGSNSSSSAFALAQQQHQARAAQMGLAQAKHSGSASALKRKLMDLEGGGLDGQGNSKR